MIESETAQAGVKVSMFFGKEATLKVHFTTVFPPPLSSCLYITENQ